MKRVYPNDMAAINDIIEGPSWNGNLEYRRKIINAISQLKPEAINMNRLLLDAAAQDQAKNKNFKGVDVGDRRKIELANEYAKYTKDSIPFIDQENGVANANGMFEKYLGKEEVKKIGNYKKPGKFTNFLRKTVADVNIPNTQDLFNHYNSGPYATFAMNPLNAGSFSQKGDNTSGILFNVPRLEQDRSLARVSSHELGHKFDSQGFDKKYRSENVINNLLGRLRSEKLYKDKDIINQIKPTNFKPYMTTKPEGYHVDIGEIIGDKALGGDPNIPEVLGYSVGALPNEWSGRDVYDPTNTDSIKKDVSRKILRNVLKDFESNLMNHGLNEPEYESAANMLRGKIEGLGRQRFYDNNLKPNSKPTIKNSIQSQIQPTQQTSQLSYQKQPDSMEMFEQNNLPFKPQENQLYGINFSNSEAYNQQPQNQLQTKSQPDIMSLYKNPLDSNLSQGFTNYNQQPYGVGGQGVSGTYSSTNYSEPSPQSKAKGGSVRSESTASLLARAAEQTKRMRELQERRELMSRPAPKQQKPTFADLMILRQYLDSIS